MKDFFISYTKADRERALWIKDVLEAAEYSTVIDVSDFPPGANWAFEMEKAIKHTKRTLAVLSPDYFIADFTWPEWLAAFRRDPRGEQRILLPVLVRACELPELLKAIVHLDLTDKDDDVAKTVLLAGVSGNQAELPIASQRDKLLAAYADNLAQHVSKLRIFGDEQLHPLDQVFVELSINEEYDRRPNQTEFLGLMDSELRRMRSVFGDAEQQRDYDPDAPTQRHLTKTKRTIKPDELLRRHTHAVITGAPGCGKTTLLRYLAWQTLKQWQSFSVPPSGGEASQDAIPPEGGALNTRLPVFLELKQLSAADFQQGSLEDLLFRKAIAVTVKPRGEAERDSLQQHFRRLLEQGRVAVFLDGLDEVSGASFFRDLQTAVSEFLQSAYGHNTVIISTRPFVLRQFSDAKMMEIQPLNPRQIEQFIKHYYRDVPERQQFQRELQRRRELRELARVPALLGFILQLWRKRGTVTDDKLELYAQITDDLAQQLDTEKEGVPPERKWLVEDKDGSLKLDLLRQLAFHQLFKGLIRPPYDIGSTDNDATRLVFTGEQLRDEAAAFARMLKEREGLTIHPRNLAEDVKATALLRQVGADHYAFAHLTLQEYLAAWQLAKRDNGDTCERIFCRAYFNPTLAEMEVLPMALGLVDEPDKLYKALEQLPESLTFVAFRLYIRGMGYGASLNQDKEQNLIRKAVEFVAENERHEAAFSNAVLSACLRLTNKLQEFLVSELIAMFNLRGGNAGWKAICALGDIGSDAAIGTLIAALDEDDYEDIAVAATSGLGEMASEAVLKALIDMLPQRNWRGRNNAIKALGKTGSEIAVTPLINLIETERENNSVVLFVTEAFGEIRSKSSVETLIKLLEDEENPWQSDAARALGEIGDERAIGALEKATQCTDQFVRVYSEQALCKIKGVEDNKRVPAAFPLLKDESVELLSFAELVERLEDTELFVSMFAAYDLGKSTDVKAVPVLLNAINHHDINTTHAAARSLCGFPSEKLLAGLQKALSHELESVRRKAASVIAYYTKKVESEELARLAVSDPIPEVKVAAQLALQKFERKLQYFDIPIPTTTTNDPSHPSPPPPLTPQARAELETRIAAKYQEVLRGGNALQKGKALEELLAAVFASISGFTVSERNYHTATEEIDLVLRNASADPFWQAWGSLLLVEAKNWQSQRVGKNEYVQFYRKLENRGGHCTLGFLVCTDRCAEPFHPVLLRDSKLPLRVVPIDGEGLRQLVEAEDRSVTLRGFVERAVLQ